MASRKRWRPSVIASSHSQARCLPVVWSWRRIAAMHPSPASLETHPPSGRVAPCRADSSTGAARPSNMYGRSTVRFRHLWSTALPAWSVCARSWLRPRAWRVPCDAISTWHGSCGPVHVSHYALAMAAMRHVLGFSVGGFAPAAQDRKARQSSWLPGSAFDKRSNGLLPLAEAPGSAARKGSCRLRDAWFADTEEPHALLAQWGAMRQAGGSRRCDAVAPG